MYYISGTLYELSKVTIGTAMPISTCLMDKENKVLDYFVARHVALSSRTIIETHAPYIVNPKPF